MYRKALGTNFRPLLQARARFECSDRAWLNPIAIEYAW